MPGRKKPPKPICQTVLADCPMLDKIIRMSEDVAKLKSDMRWVKWLLVVILASLLGTAVFV